MIEPLIAAAALLTIFLSMIAGSKFGAFPALRWMLGSLLALGVALRYWFLASQSVRALEPTPIPLLSALCFWLLFTVILYGFRKACDDYLEPFESETPSVIERLLGAVFGGVTGAVLASAVVMTACFLAPEQFTASPSILPVRIEETPITAYRFIETNLAKISEKDPAHTRLPHFRDPAQPPALFK
jgi:hypothetical protein